MDENIENIQSEPVTQIPITATGARYNDKDTIEVKTDTNTISSVNVSPVDEEEYNFEKQYEKNFPDNLTPKQALFVIEYLKDLNATQAAIRAGYSSDPNVAGVQGYENLRKPKIKIAINSQMEARAIRTQITADKILADMDRLAQRCMQAEPVMIFNKINQKWEQLGAAEGEPVYQFDSAGANKALENLARNQKLLTDKTEVGNLDGTNFEFPNIEEVFVSSPEALKEDNMNGNINQEPG